LKKLGVGKISYREAETGGAVCGLGLQDTTGESLMNILETEGLYQ
jgi:hypothetical protein